MKSIYLVFLLFFLSAGLRGQQYYKMLDSTTTWFQEWSWDGGGSGDGNLDKYFFEGDTMIEGYQYFRLHHLSQHFSFGGAYTVYYDIYEPTGNFFLREDTIQKRIYSLEISGTDTIKSLFYDFDLEIGDTLQFNSPDPSNIVTGIDSVLINGDYRKRFSIGVDGGWDQYCYLIEGVGSTFGLVAILEPPFETPQFLLCFTQQGETTIFEDLTWQDSTEFCEFKIPLSVPGNQFQPIILSPNPVNDFIVINNSFNLTGNSTYSIYNLSGILLLSGEITDQNTAIDIKDLPNGFYVISLNSDNYFWQGSFTKQEY